MDKDMLDWVCGMFSFICDELLAMKKELAIGAAVVVVFALSLYKYVRDVIRESRR